MRGIFCTKDCTSGIDGSAESVRAMLVGMLGTERIFTLNQVHGCRIVRVSEIGPNEITVADGIISVSPDDVLVIKTADCVPVLISSEEGVYAAVHAGWKGIAQGIIGKCIKMMIDMGAADIYVGIGPAIGPCCFKVGDDVAGMFPDRFIREDRDGKYIDLWEAAKFQALSAGVEKHRISVLRLCTCCKQELFFSYRRQASNTGRQISMIGGGELYTEWFSGLKYCGSPEA